MIHQRLCLPLGLEAGDDLARIHTGLKHLQGDFPAQRFLLLGPEDHAEAPLAQ